MRGTLGSKVKVKQSSISLLQPLFTPLPGILNVKYYPAEPLNYICWPFELLKIYAIYEKQRDPEEKNQKPWSVTLLFRLSHSPLSPCIHHVHTARIHLRDDLPQILCGGGHKGGG